MIKTLDDLKQAVQLRDTLDNDIKDAAKILIVPRETVYSSDTKCCENCAFFNVHFLRCMLSERLMNVHSLEDFSTWVCDAYGGK